ncbi:hypothetical protein A2773_02545 [Candidatus Gottesmanbacteria bacterium RIFCSPHIGHO2_01_FULL_39_10]|uniref:DUF2191 domain-containing protein n=1 Tax=Candidatus Gottesmanbacteria bacterium RIFCSPHIGHO2_01_FULL_39_10 TaxID=1798375 RepID=A0A1F5ZRB8_9BACT|nr:MAG: hypothetical protein A2773_02545 [Candidatus Gottesmanbacteria bacterium RIFCSPHIGHO2_01_FULL_39_10]
MLYMQTSNIRTTIYLDEDLYMKAKKKALEERTTLTKLIKNGLKREIAKKNKKKTKSKRNALLEIAKLGFRGGPKDLSANMDDYLYGGKK